MAYRRLKLLTFDVGILLIAQLLVRAVQFDLLQAIFHCLEHFLRRIEDFLRRHCVGHAT